MIKNLYELYNLIEKVSTALPNVNQFVNSFDSLNREDTSYAAVVLQFRDGTQATEGTVRYRFYLGYVDRVNENTDTPSTSNNILTQSIAEENIRLIINKLYPEVDITFGNTFYPFTQRFTALTAGCYVELAITLAVKDCNYESGSVLRDVEIVSDSNGVKEVVPGAGVDGFKKVIVRTEVPLKTEIEKDIVITANGNTTYTPDEGQSFSKVNVDVNVPVKEEVVKEISITSNGLTTITPPAEKTLSKVDVNVNVPSVDDVIPYFDRKPTADDAGLKEIGWDDESVNYYKYNNYTYPWEADNYKVSDANKQIVINNKSDIETNRNNPDFKYCPMFDTSNMTSMDNMFSNCKSLTSIPLLNTSKVTWMQSMFKGCTSLTTIPQLNTSNVTYMSYMFEGCKSLTSVPLFDTSNVTDMGNMFLNCKSLTTIPQLNTSNVKSMKSMFAGCNGLTTIPQLDTSKVTDMSYMFQICPSLTSIPQLNTSNVTNMNNMFTSCKSLTAIPQLDTSKVTDMGYMFSSCESLTTIPQLDTGKVTNMSNMFYDCLSLTSIPKLDATSLTNTNLMFGYYFYGLEKLTDFGGLTNLKVDLDFTPCPALTKESLLNVFNEAADVTASPKTLTLGETNLAKLTDEEKAIATNKGWILK